ncbi:MAG: aspartate aminotransferase family protein, partial [Candidatus Gastranaerophilales bacterium]|nr:aspartate aminotransferase family protein [Candidatus Gastranaerophilales bacterium]
YIEKGKQYVMNTYNYYPVVIDRGEGCYVWDTEGKKYLDFVAGIAVNSLGYGNKDYIDNMTAQLHKFNHCSNLYYNLPQIELAEILVNNSCFDSVFFCNSGAEAVEAALKLSRKYGKKTHDEECYEIISMKHSFHGRTFGAVTATGQEKYQKGLEPLLPGIKYAKFNSIDSVKELVTDKTCAILVEPIQGEGGIHPAKKEFLEDLRNLCNEKDIVLIFDEVQCGIGRTGKLFAYELYDVKPDIVSVAKGLGGGFPIGAMLAVKKVSEAFQPGDHASTFGGNPLACTAGKTVLNHLLNKKLLINIEINGIYLTSKLLELKQNFEIIKDLRGVGLMQGIELSVTASPIVSKCMEKGLLLIGAGANIIRFVPPLIVTQDEIDKAIEILTVALQEIKNES